MYRNSEFLEMREKTREYILDYLKEYKGYLCDLHNECFNTDYYVYDNDEAIEELEILGNVFDEINYIKEYEQLNYGQVYTDFSSPIEVLSMLWYIIGEEELFDMFDGCEKFEEFWNENIGFQESQFLINWYNQNKK